MQPSRPEGRVVRAVRPTDRRAPAFRPEGQAAGDPSTSCSASELPCDPRAARRSAFGTGGQPARCGQARRPTCMHPLTGLTVGCSASRPEGRVARAVRPTDRRAPAFRPEGQAAGDPSTSCSASELPCDPRATRRDAFGTGGQPARCEQARRPASVHPPTGDRSTLRRSTRGSLGVRRRQQAFRSRPPNPKVGRLGTFQPDDRAAPQVEAREPACVHRPTSAGQSLTTKPEGLSA